MPSSNQLNALLAMPASFRIALLAVSPRIRPTRICVSHTSLRRHASSKYPNIAAFLIPEFRTSQPSEIPPEELFKTSYLPSAPEKPLQDELTTLFMKNPPIFQYGESDFYKLKKNTRVPEVCVLGRSNVGKSSFVNALAGRHTNVLAYISSKAGKTRAMNTYGFGPAPSPKDLAAQSAKYKGKEDIPTHSFNLVDMPGYGHASLKEWGRNITLYLTKRVGVKGAIVLIDAEVGPKQTDLQMLELLSSAGTRTAIVLTKADKVKGGLSGLRDTCTKLWDDILKIEKMQENNNWHLEKEVFVTAVGARDHAVVSSTVTTARLAVARLAGLVVDTRPKPDKNQKWSGKVISFEDLQYAPNTDTAATSRMGLDTQASRQVRVGAASSVGVKETVSSFASLERASAGTVPRGRHRPRSRTSSSPGLRTTRSYARNFHNSAKSRDKKQLPYSQDSSDMGMHNLVEDYVKQVRGRWVNKTASSYARDMRRTYDRLLPENRNILERREQREARMLRKRFPEDTERIREVHQKRLSITERRARTREQREREKLQESKHAWNDDNDGGVIEDPPFEQSTINEVKDVPSPDEYMTPDMFKDLVTAPKLKEGKKKKGKKGRKGKKGKKDNEGKEEEEPLDEFDTQFSSAFSK